MTDTNRMGESYHVELVGLVEEVCAKPRAAYDVVMKHAVIFDIDGVLVDSYKPHLASWQALAEELGQTVTEEQFATSFGRTSRDIIDLWWRKVPGLGETLTDERISEMDERKEALYRKMLEKNFPAIDGAADLISALHAEDFGIAAGSSGPPANVELSLRLLGRSEKFAARVTGADVTRGKPDPQVFLLAAEKLGVEAARCAVIEDAPAGIDAANRAGMFSIALLGTASRDALSAADLIVASLRELSPQRIAALIDR